MLKVTGSKEQGSKSQKELSRSQASRKKSQGHDNTKLKMTEQTTQGHSSGRNPKVKIRAQGHWGTIKLREENLVTGFTGRKLRS